MAVSKQARKYIRRAMKGAAWLDLSGLGDWRARISTEGLDLMCADWCVLGQLFKGGFGVAVEKLGLEELEIIEYGFTLDESEWSHPSDWFPLTEAWRVLIRSSAIQTGGEQ